MLSNNYPFLKYVDDTHNLTLYYAGYPRFLRNFTRDSIISALLMEDDQMLKHQLLYSKIFQGKKINAITGEEPGKIHHEYPGFALLRNPDLLTTYNACDTTSLYLIGHEKYFVWTGDTSLISQSKDSILHAANHLLSHIDERHLFVEDPAFSGEKQYALKVTYWKDSSLVHREGGKPIYPISYFLVQAQTIAALRSAEILLQDSKYGKNANLLLGSLKKYFLDAHKPIIAIDRDGPVEAITSDLLHSLYYLKKDDLLPAEIEFIVNLSRDLETNIGYLTMAEHDSALLTNTYHSKTVWPFEQALIHAGALKFNLKSVANVAQRIIKLLDKTDTEFFLHQDDKFIESGCNPQLWTMAAKYYFDKLDQI
jgi:glycogen debranching enzyme